MTETHKAAVEALEAMPSNRIYGGIKSATQFKKELGEWAFNNLDALRALKQPSSVDGLPYPEDCNWPQDGKFWWKDENPEEQHNAVYLFMPCGGVLQLSHYNNMTTDPARAAWIAEACNYYRDLKMATTSQHISSVEVTEELPLDLTTDEFAEIFTHWKNQQGMNGFLTRMNVKHLIWMFECLKQNNLRITRAAATDEVKS